MKKKLLVLAAIAVAVAPSANAELIYGVTFGNQLVTFDSAAPTTILTASFITGLQMNESILGIDFRPATGQLYALGSTSRLYTLNVANGAATAVSAGFTPTLNGTNFGFDFNPTVDRIRLVSDLEQNLRLNPDTGAATTDTALSYVAGDPGAGSNPAVTSAAYTNSFPGATTTTVYYIDAGRNTLVTSAAPNAGTLTTIGSLGLDTTGVSGFDISSATGVAYAALQLTNTPGSRLYTVNLATGSTTFLGEIGTAGTSNLIRGIALVPVPEPGTLLVLAGASLGLLRRRRRTRS